MANGPSDDSAASSSAMPRVLRGLLSATGEAPVLDGFGDVGGTDVVAAGQIGDGPGDFQDAMPGAGRQIELCMVAARFGDVGGREIASVIAEAFPWGKILYLGGSADTAAEDAAATLDDLDAVWSYHPSASA